MSEILFVYQIRCSAICTRKKISPDVDLNGEFVKRTITVIIMRFHSRVSARRFEHVRASGRDEV